MQFRGPWPQFRMPWPEDRARRAMVVGLVCSILFHLGLLASLLLVNTFTPPLYVKRGEALFVDIAPEKPQEKAPLGDPARPVGPEREEPPPRPAAAPPAPPKLAEAPRPPAPKPAPAPKAPPTVRPQPVPEPPKQVAKAEPVPAPAKPEPRPEPAPAAPAPKAPEQPTPPPQPEPAPAAKAEPSPASPPAPPSRAEPSPAPPPARESQSQTALAKPRPDVPAGIFRQPPGGGGGLRGGRGGVEGDPIPLDTPEPRYQDYFNKIRERIKANWIYPREAGERGIQGDLLIEFHIAKDGRLQHIDLRRSSGEEILDRFALNAVRLAQPFPPVPDDIAKQVLAINGLFRYQIVSGFVNQFLR